MIKISRILHPTDFSDSSRPALQYASELARQFDAELHLLSVVDNRGFVSVEPGLFPEDYIQEYLKAVEKQLADLTTPGMEKCRKVVREVRPGIAFIEIVKYAGEADVDMIVMGTHGRTGLGHLIIGSVAENVVRKAPCPVLTVCPAGVLKRQRT